MSDRRKIVLHIGLHKTGTSTIQNTLHANREFLLEQERVLYPSLAPNPNTALGTIFRDDPREQIANRMRGFTIEEIAARRNEFLNSLDAEVSSSEWDTLLLSDEGVCNFSLAEIARLREWGERYSSEWTVLVCVRHPVDWTRSVIQQLLKRGKTLQQLYEKPPRPTYRARISRAISVFGRENVRVYDFEGATEGEGGIVGTFARRAGLSPSSANFLASRALRRYNESLSLEAARILDSLNRQRPMFVDKVRAPRRAGPGHELAYLGRIKGQKFDVPDHVKEQIRSLNRHDVAWLNETFGLGLYRDLTDDDDLTAPRGRGHDEAPAAPEALSEPAVESIAEIFGELVAEGAFHRHLEQGRAALGRGNLERAARNLREAARLDPEAVQPKKLLKEVTLKDTAPEDGTLKGGPREEASAKRSGRLSRWLRPK